MISGSSRCACYIPRMVLDQRTCVRKFGAFGCLFIFICIYLALVASFCSFGIIKISSLSKHACVFGGLV
jgi:hypothetical protein